MTPLAWIKIAFVVLVVGSLVGGGWKMKSIIEENKQLRARDDAMLVMIKKGQADNLRQDELFAQRDEEHNAVREGVADVTVRIKQESVNDQGTRNFLAAKLPDGMRRAIIQAAAARAAAECQGADCANGDRRNASDKPVTGTRPNQ